MKFKYNGKIYNPINLEKKLKKLGITIDDIELIEELKNTNENTYSNNSTLYYFKKDDPMVATPYLGTDCFWCNWCLNGSTETRGSFLEGKSIFLDSRSR